MCNNVTLQFGNIGCWSVYIVYIKEWIEVHVTHCQVENVWLLKHHNYYQCIDVLQTRLSSYILINWKWFPCLYQSGYPVWFFNLKYYILVLVIF